MNGSLIPKARRLSSTQLYSSIIDFVARYKAERVVVSNVLLASVQWYTIKGLV